MRSKRSFLVVVLFSLLATFIVPMNVHANIMCNDGQRSPTCQDCHRGCCSHHGGCASGYSDNSYSNSWLPYSLCRCYVPYAE